MHRQEPVDASNLAADACAPQQQHERLQQQQPQGHAQQQQPPQQQQQQEQQQQQQQQKQQQQQQQQVAQARPPALAFTHPKAGSMVIASLRQQANPIIKFFSSVPFCFAPIAPDFLVGVGSCVVFLSLKYHRLHPKQLLQRLLPLQRRRELSRRFLLLLNDVEGAHASLAQVILHAFHYGFILLVAASPAEAAELLQQLKASENRASDALQPALDDRHAPRCAEVLRVLPSVNRADFVSLAKEFRCMRNIFKARQQQLQQCPGIGPKKVRVLLAAFEEPFFPDTDDRFTAAAASRSIAAAAAAATEAAAIKDSGETDTAQANTKQPTAALKAITG
ncbi:DNA repair protein rad10 domain-containing protein, putative [Eimeria mitis]|uniref:DNA repair protein rad10 domain-containing protein, putative n=2 Tax=Eimeria mitis TaxID=44415 RepID=U6JWC1_9EIME|nr:DNA repair protein rad10 domain-containing protein, putative [Eimeria mitis]CDJ29719.1 DNA repair protein rad10 domain-containing protein, putative [Eimeria mitis]